MGRHHRRRIAPRRVRRPRLDHTPSAATESARARSAERKAADARRHRRNEGLRSAASTSDKPRRTSEINAWLLVRKQLSSP